jgi:transposase
VKELTKTRKQYSKEFKLDAISLVVDQGFTRKEAAASLEINAQMLGRWIKESKDEDGQAFRGNGKLTPDQEEIKRLKEENRRLQMERDILKKVTAGITLLPRVFSVV